ncbi:type II toxin-antitoxin system Phd/YefM family antitoxin [Peptostreptococcaceae bacterium AGR-M142]
MKALASSNVRKDFKNVCDMVVSDSETVIITRSGKENVVMMSEDEYNNIIENFRIFSNPILSNKISKGIEQIEKGFSKKRELLDE